VDYAASPIGNYCRQSHFSRDGRHGLSEKRCTLEGAAQMANHASTRTTQLYDRRTEEVSFDEVERILV
jgi:hypothetical protein